MKLLHTSDWHLGRMTYNVSRAPDHDAVLAEIIEIARVNKPDLILHTGDLFDAPRPAYFEMERGIHALQELAAIAPVIVLCGNHDSPALFRLFQRLLGPTNRMKFVDRPRLPDDGGIVEVHTPAGERIRVAPVPFIHANRLVDAFVPPSAVMTTYADHVGAIARALDAGLRAGYDGSHDVLIYAAHLHVAGAILSKSEQRLHVTDTYATLPEHFPVVSYVAFGHIHKPQPLPGNLGSYAGSPIQLDFGELGEQKRVVIVEATAGRPAQITSVPLARGRWLRNIEGSLDEIRAIAPSVSDELCLVTVRTDAPTPGLSEEIRDMLPRATILNVAEDCPALRINVVTRSSIPDTQPDVASLFEEYLTQQPTYSASASEVLRIFSEFLSVSGEDRDPLFEEMTILEASNETSNP